MDETESQSLKIVNDVYTYISSLPEVKTKVGIDLVLFIAVKAMNLVEQYKALAGSNKRVIVLVVVRKIITEYEGLNLSPERWDIYSDPS